MKLSATAILAAASLFIQPSAVCGDSEHVASALSRGDGSAINFYLQKTSAAVNSDTLLIALQGSDCNSVLHDAFIRQQARSLWPAADLLLVEKTGITSDLKYSENPERLDCPASYLEQDSPEQRVQDLKAVVDRVLNTHPYTRIIAMGGSEGAVVAAAYAADTGVPSAVVLVNGGGRWFINDVFHNIRATVPPEALQTELQGFAGFVEHIVGSEPSSLEVSGHGYTWWRSVLTMDLQNLLSKIEVPILVVQGGRDESVSPEAVVEMIRTLQEAGKTKIELRLYPELDHGLAAADGQYHTKSVVAEVAAWLQAKLPPPPQSASDTATAE